MASPTMTVLAQAQMAAMSGVTYTPRYGACCPWCGRRTKISTTLPWDGDVRIRYHYCKNKRCPLAVMRISIKSVEVV